MPLAVRVPGCTVAPCVFQRGSVINVEADFIAPTGALSLTVDFWMIIGGIHVFYELPADQVNACNNLTGASCPLGFNYQATHHFTFYVSDAIPVAVASIEASLINHASETVACSVLEVHLTD